MIILVITDKIMEIVISRLNMSSKSITYVHMHKLGTMDHSRDLKGSCKQTRWKRTYFRPSWIVFMKVHKVDQIVVEHFNIKVSDLGLWWLRTKNENVIAQRPSLRSLLEHACHRLRQYLERSLSSISAYSIGVASLQNTSSQILWRSVQKMIQY